MTTGWGGKSLVTICNNKINFELTWQERCSIYDSNYKILLKNMKNDCNTSKVKHTIFPIL